MTTNSLPSKADEIKMQRLVYKNLYNFILKNNFPNGEAGRLLNFLVANKKEILLLLTNGNLDTVYAPRDFVKQEGKDK